MGNEDHRAETPSSGPTRWRAPPGGTRAAGHRADCREDAAGEEGLSEGVKSAIEKWIDAVECRMPRRASCGRAFAAAGTFA